MSTTASENATVIDVTTAAQAQALAADILRRRDTPLVLVSARTDGSMHFDDDHLRKELAGIAEVVTILTGEATYELEALVPARTHVYGGAARSYPPDFGFDPAPERSPLRFTFTANSDQLIADAMAQGGSRTVESAPHAPAAEASGIVKGFLAGGTHALVTLDNGLIVTAAPERLPAGIRLDKALQVGDHITGALTPDGHGLRLAPFVAASDYFPDGCLTLALVTKTTAARATVELEPGTGIILRRRDVTEDPDHPIHELVTVGDVVRARVRYEDDGTIGLSLIDVDPDAALHPSVPLVVGASPWLREGQQAEPPAEERSDAAAPPSGTIPAVAPAALDGLATSGEVSALRHEVVALRGDILALTNLVARLPAAKTPDAADNEIGRLRAQVAALDAQLRTERAERATAETNLAEQHRRHREQTQALRDARKSDGTSDGFAEASDREEWVRRRISDVWEERMTGNDRDTWPLREHRIGPGYVASLAGLTETQRCKAIRASVDAVTGRDREIPGRDLHRLRSGGGGDDAPVTRDDGAKCWRSAIEQNAPSARRLHYWELPGGTIELSRVVLHDDVEP